jgi:hypothetical protein
LQQEESSDRLKPKKETKKEKRTKRQSVEDSVLLEQQEHKPKSPVKADLSHFASKNPLQVDDETIDAILQDLKHFPVQPLLPLHEPTEPEPVPPESTPSGRSVREIVERLSLLLAQDITPELTIGRGRVVSETDSLQPTQGNKSKRKKLQLQTSDDHGSPASEHAAESGPPTQKPSSVVDLTEALSALSPSQELSSFSTAAKFFFFVLNKEFGCLSSMTLFFTLSRLPIQPLQPLVSRSQSAHHPRQDKDLAPQSILERILHSLCRSLQLQPALIAHLAKSPRLLAAPKADDLLSSTKILFTSGTAVALVDLTHFSLILIQKWAEKTFPLVLQHHQKLISKQDSASARKIFWPPFILSVLPSLFAILQRVLTVSLREWDALQDSASPWVGYVCSSGFIDQISVLFRELQCVADFCEKDEFVSFLLCQLSQLTRDYCLLVRFSESHLSPL